MTYPYCYFNESIVNIEDAKVSIASNSLQYGTTAFAGIKAYKRGGKLKVLRLYDHHERLMQASKMMMMDYRISYDEFHDIIKELFNKNKPDGDCYIRPFIMSTDEIISPKKRGLNFQLAIYMLPMNSYIESANGLKLMTSSIRKFSDTMFPTKAKAGGCYVNSFLATTEANLAGYDEALLTDNEGYIVEASVANIGILYRDKVIMPPIGSAMLEGITMRTVVEFIEEEKIPLLRERIDRSMIFSCQEMWLMGTAIQVMPVASVDGRKIEGKGAIVKLLKDKFANLLDQNHPYVEEF